jgi:hypothetical protein
VAGNVDRTLKVLNEIRTQQSATNARLDALATRVDGNTARLDALEQVTREGFLRVSTELVELHGTLRDVRDVLVDRREDRLRLDDHERRLHELEKNVG